MAYELLIETIDYGQLTMECVHTEFKVNGQLSMVNSVLTPIVIPNWIYYLFAGFLGACVGSFLNVCIIRIPQGESILRPRSHCRACGHKISWWENIPIASYLILKGRCRGCLKPIPFQYITVEAISAGLSVCTWWKFHEPRFYFVYFFLLTAPLIIMSFIDIAHRIIPNGISLPGIVAGFAAHFALAPYGMRYDAAIDSVLGIIVGGGFLYIVAVSYERLRKIEGLGGGDVKLAAMLGAFFGWRAALLILLISSSIGSIFGLLLILLMKRDAKYPIPFGPFLSLGGLVYLFFGPSIIEWYLNLL